MGYPEKLLNPGEHVAVDVVPHWKYMAAPALAVAIVLAGAIAALEVEPQPPRWAELAIAGVMVLSLVWLVVRYLRWATTSFVVTNQRLVLRKGVFRRTGREILIDRLSDITYKQTLTDRLLRCGDILLESPGRDGQETLKDLPQPIRIQNEICRLVSQRNGAQGTAAGAQGVVSSTPDPVAGPSGTGPAGPGTAQATVTGAGRVYVGAAADVATGQLSEPTVAEQLSQLDELRRRGVISRREFAAKKSELLSRM
jgi:membrane protein YdbS with pleckstrin-like domain